MSSSRHRRRQHRQECRKGQGYWRWFQVGSNSNGRMSGQDVLTAILGPLVENTGATSGYGRGGSVEIIGRLISHAHCEAGSRGPGWSGPCCGGFVCSNTAGRGRRQFSYEKKLWLGGWQLQKGGAVCCKSPSNNRDKGQEICGRGKINGWHEKATAAAMADSEN